jgi:hypothetical protein
MKSFKKSVALTLMLLGLGISPLFTIKSVNAQCGCSCTPICRDTCLANCSGCTPQQAVITADQCCEGILKVVDVSGIDCGGGSF